LVAHGCAEQATQTLVDYFKWASVEEFCTAVPERTLSAVVESAKGTDFAKTLDKTVAATQDRYAATPPFYFIFGFILRFGPLSRCALRCCRC
jgi:hypothetical protein